MNLRLLSALLGLGLAAPVFAQDVTPVEHPATATPESDLKELIGRISAKLKAGAQDAADFAADAADFDALLAKYRDNKSEGVARIAYMQATFYLQIMGDDARARELLEAMKTKFAGTEGATAAEQALASIAAMEQAQAKQQALIGRPAPALHFQWSTRDGLKTLADLKGQVVVLDFWATWCGPCIASFPQVRAHVAHFKGSPVAFVGVTSIQGFVANMGSKIDTKGDPEKEMALMPDFMKAKDMTWDVAFSEEEVFNPDYAITGIPYLAIIAPDGTVRHVALHPGDESADIAGKITAILKEFHLPVPI